DLDLLVRDADMPPIEQALARDGFRNRGDEWVRFRDCTADAVELVQASTWHLGGPELDDLYAQARPLDGLDRVVRPAPQHALLVLARLTAQSVALPEKRRRRVEAALAEQPDAWQLAGDLAPAWSLQPELERLE